MGEQRVAGAKVKLCLTIALVIVIAVLVLASGCGASTPQAAVEKYYAALSNSDWNAYLNVILPDNVRRMTSSDIQSGKASFKEGSIKYTGLKFKTIPDRMDKDRAEVAITAGNVKFTDPATGAKKSMTVQQIKRAYRVSFARKAVKYKGSWYVDVPMASADMTQQQ